MKIGQQAAKNNRRRMRINVIAFAPKDRRVGDAVKKNCARLSGLCQIDGQLGKCGATGNVRLHDLRTAREKRDVDIYERLGRNDLRDLNLTGKLLKQPGVLLGFEQSEPSHRKAAVFQHFAQLFSQERRRSDNRYVWRFAKTFPVHGV